MLFSAGDYFCPLRLTGGAGDVYYNYICKCLDEKR